MTALPRRIAGRVTGRVVAAAYVAAVAGLTAAAFSGHDVVRWAEVAVAILTLPSVVVALPVVYMVGALAWSLVDSPSSGSASSTDPVQTAPIWPVTLAFTVVMTLVACANAVIVRHACRAVLAGRSAALGERPGPVARGLHRR